MCLWVHVYTAVCVYVCTCVLYRYMHAGMHVCSVVCVYTIHMLGLQMCACAFCSTCACLWCARCVNVCVQLCSVCICACVYGCVCTCVCTGTTAWEERGRYGCAQSHRHGSLNTEPPASVGSPSGDRLLLFTKHSLSSTSTSVLCVGALCPDENEKKKKKCFL